MPALTKFDLRAPDGRRDLPTGAVLVLVWAVPAILAIVETYTFTRMAGRPIHLGTIVLREGATWATYGLLSPFVFRLANRYPLTSPMRRANLALHLMGAIVIGLVAAIAATAAVKSTLMSTDPVQYLTMSAPRLFLSWFLGGLPVAFLSYFAIVGVAHAIGYFREAQQRREDALRLEKQLADARLAALQGRLHPHFLYNTLNAISVLVRDGDVAGSTRMLELLGAMLRRVLDGSLPQIIPLAEELALLRQYLEIEEVRFSDRLSVVVDVDALSHDAGVPALVTQPLAENVIRHAVANTSRHVTLTIAARVVREASGERSLVLSVTDDGPGFTDGWERRREERTGIAATNLRIMTLYGSRGTLDIGAGESGGTVSRITIPYTAIAKTDDITHATTGAAIPVIGSGST